MRRVTALLPPGKDSSNRPRRSPAAILRASLLVVGLLSMISCRPRPAPPPQGSSSLGWRPVASWSGRGNTQTESFSMESGQWRIRWKTRDSQPSGTGLFRVIVHSTVSGRFVEVAVEHLHSGSGLVYVQEDPRQFFLEIESTGLDWNVAVEEGITGSP